MKRIHGMPSNKSDMPLGMGIYPDGTLIGEYMVLPYYVERMKTNPTALYAPELGGNVEKHTSKYSS